MNILLVTVSLLLLADTSVGKKKKKSSKKTGSALFTSENLTCLVCKSLVDEIEHMINKVDPKKKTETGTFRLNADGTQNKNIIPYARSQGHLMEVVDEVCKNFEDYAQATSKASGKPMIIRIVTHEGNMNPIMGEVDMVPDDDLNTRLKFYCENIVEDAEDDIMELFAQEREDMDIELCSKRRSLCDDIAQPADDYTFEKEEL